MNIKQQLIERLAELGQQIEKLPGPETQARIWQSTGEFATCQLGKIQAIANILQKMAESEACRIINDRVARDKPAEPPSKP